MLKNVGANTTKVICSQMLSDFYYHDNWLINCFQQKIPNSFGNHLSQFLSKNPKSQTFARPTSRDELLLSFFISVNWLCLEFGLFVWQKPNEKQKCAFKSSLKTLNRLWDLKINLKNNQQIDWWWKYVLTAIWITAESNLNHSRKPQNTSTYGRLHQKCSQNIFLAKINSVIKLFQ